MSAICQNCGKGTVFGSSKQHRRGVAGKRWKKRVTPTPRTFKVNLQKFTITIAGKSKQYRLCAKCIKRFKKDGKLKSLK